MNKDTNTFFISGFDWFGLSNDNHGVEDMARAVQGAQSFTYKDEKEILNQILKLPKDKPVILVGHSMGGKAATNIANELNSPEKGFRQVDLLVTLDAFGWGPRHVIPQNVRQHLNFISDQDTFLSDGPHIAKDSRYTNVTNELRPELHTAIDNSVEVQYQIMNHINNVLGTDSVKVQNQMSQGSKLPGDWPRDLWIIEIND